MKVPEKKQQKKDILENFYALFESRERVLNVFNSKIFPTKTEGTDSSHKVSDYSNHKVLTPKQMLQTLPIAIAQVKAGNTSETLLNEIRKIIYSLHQPKDITKKVYNDIMNSIKLQNRMDTTFMNSEDSKTSYPHRLLLNLSDKINLKRSDKCVALSNLSIHYAWKNIKKAYKNNKFQTSSLTWNGEFELPDESYSVSDILVYFE